MLEMVSLAYFSFKTGGEKIEIDRLKMIKWEKKLIPVA